MSDEYSELMQEFLGRNEITDNEWKKIFDFMDRDYSYGNFLLTPIEESPILKREKPELYNRIKQKREYVNRDHDY